MIQSSFAAKRTDQIQRYPKKEGSSSPIFLARLSTPYTHIRSFIDPGKLPPVTSRRDTTSPFKNCPSPIIIPVIFEIETTEK